MAEFFAKNGFVMAVSASKSASLCCVLAAKTRSGRQLPEVSEESLDKH